MDRDQFFAAIRHSPFGGTLSQDAVVGITAILDEWDQRKLTDLRWLGFMLATGLIEVGHNMQPVREGFKATDAEARAYVKAKGYKYAVVVSGQVFYGRGITQNTWFENYKKLTDLAKSQGFTIDFVSNPDLFLTPRWAVWSMFEGMIRGIYTGKKLADFFNGSLANWFDARTIINGHDRAAECGSYAQTFYGALVAAQVAEKPAQPLPVPPAPIPVQPYKPPVAPPQPPAQPVPTGFPMPQQPPPVFAPTHQQMGIGAVILAIWAGVTAMFSGAAYVWPWIAGGAVILGIAALFFWRRAHKKGN